MHRNPVQILLTDVNQAILDTFDEAFAKIRIRTSVSVTDDANDLADKLKALCPATPYLALLNLDLLQKAGLSEICQIRDIMPSKHICIGAYSSSACEAQIESAFICGNNISFTLPNNVDTLADILEHVIVMFWLYYSSDFNMSHFILRINE